MVNVQIRLSDAARTDLQKYRHDTRKLKTSHSRFEWRERRKRTKNPRTQAELRAMIARRHDLRQQIKIALEEGQEKIEEIARELFETFGTHNFYWWYMALLQSSIRLKKRRKTTKWNAWLYLTKKKRKIAGLPQLKAPELSQVASEEWSAMTKLQQKEATKDAIKELEERKEMRNLALHNVPVAAFHDMRATQHQMKTEFNEMCTRTNAEGLILTVRTEWDQYNRPFVISSSERVDQFFQMTCGLSVSDFARQLEQYCLSGVGAVADNYVTELNKFKSQVSALINRKLADAGRPDNISRMFYSKFEDHITRRFGIILEGWPLKEFKPPGYNNSRPELNILFNAFNNDAARFRRLTDAEFEQWEKRNLPGTFGLHGTWAFDLEDHHTSAAGSSHGPGTIDADESMAPAVAVPSTSSPDAGPSNLPSAGSTSEGEALPIPLPSPPTVAPASETFVFRLTPAATGTTGTAAAPKVPKKRKERSDKGKKRGPNARSTSRVAPPEDTPTEP